MTEEGRFRRQAVAIALAMIVSLWVHILVLAVWQYAEPTAEELPIPPLVLEVELPPPPEEKPPLEKPVEPEKPPEPVKPPEPPKPAETDPPDAPSTPGMTPALGGSETPGLPPEEDTISLESRAPEYVDYLGHIKAAVRNHWIFPPEAQKKREQGRLTATFTLDSTGALLRILVEESSGSNILDHAALEAVRGAAPFQPFPDHIQLKRLNIKAHFDYRIKYISVE